MKRAALVILAAGALYALWPVVAVAGLYVLALLALGALWQTA